MSKPLKVKRGQRWRDKNTNRLFVITRKASGNRHWQGVNNGQTHQIHEATLLKHYELDLTNKERAK